MMLHVLVEGPSEARMLEGLLPRLIPNHRFKVYPHQGKGRLSRDPDKRPDPLQRGLLDLLPAKLRVFGSSLNPETDRVVVLVDTDEEDCVQMLERLREALESISPAPLCLFRLAIEEVEAWYLGDWEAVKRAFPQAVRARYSSYKPDSIIGTWELFQKVISDTAERKLYWAERMGGELSAEQGRWTTNRSPSFRKFCEGVLRQVGEAVPGRGAPPSRRKTERKRGDRSTIRRER
jgi:hypothetical protein